MLPSIRTSMGFYGLMSRRSRARHISSASRSTADACWKSAYGATIATPGSGSSRGPCGRSPGGRGSKCRAAARRSGRGGGPGEYVSGLPKPPAGAAIRRIGVIIRVGRDPAPAAD